MRYSQVFKSGSQASVETTWHELVDAHRLIRQGHVTDAMFHYAEAWGSGLYRYLTDSTWSIDPDPARPSLNWAAIYLGEYFHQTRTWADWLLLTAPLWYHQATWNALPIACRSRLTSLRGWAIFNGEHVRLRQIIADQRNLLRCGVAALDASHHHQVMGYAYQQMRAHDLSFEHLLRAYQMIPEYEVYYRIRALEYLGGNHYVYHEWDKALACYNQADALVDQVGPSARPLYQYYNRGWLYVERAVNCSLGTFNETDLEVAQTNYEMGIQNAELYESPYSLALNYYGLGYVMIHRKAFEQAIQCYRQALRIFYGRHGEDSYSGTRVATLMTAVCKNSLAACYSRLGKYSEAQTHAVDALYWQRKVDNPVQLHHIYWRLAKVHWRQRHFLRAIWYRAIDLALRIRLHKLK